MSLQDSIEARSLILLFLGLLLGPLCYLTPVSTNQFQCTAGPNSNPLNLVEALSSWQRHPEGAAASPTEQGSHEPWENGHHQGTDGQSKETAFPHPSSLRKDNGKAEPKPGGPHDAELCQTPQHSKRKQSPSLRELLSGFSWEANTCFMPLLALPKWGKLWTSLGAG